MSNLTPLQYGGASRRYPCASAISRNTAFRSNTAGHRYRTTGIARRVREASHNRYATR